MLSPSLSLGLDAVIGADSRGLSCATLRVSHHYSPHNLVAAERSLLREASPMCRTPTCACVVRSREDYARCFTPSQAAFRHSAWCFNRYCLSRCRVPSRRCCSIQFLKQKSKVDVFHACCITHGHDTRHRANGYITTTSDAEDLGGVGPSTNDVGEFHVTSDVLHGNFLAFPPMRCATGSKMMQAAKRGL